MLDKDEEGGEGGEVEQHHHQHNHQDQASAGVHSPVIMVTLIPDHGVMTSCDYHVIMLLLPDRPGTHQHHILVTVHHTAAGQDYGQEENHR